MGEFFAVGLPRAIPLIPAWVSAFVGLPYAQVDCWHLVRAVFAERWGVELPDWTVDRQGLPVETILTEGPAWVLVAPDEARLGDVVAITKGSVVYHVGLVVAPGWMLHTLEGLDSALERYKSFLWRHRLAGIYRHPAFAGFEPAIPG
jgi:probable lipoprotein NlpC